MKNKKHNSKTIKKRALNELKRSVSFSNKKSPIALFREIWLKEGIELIDITQLCEIKINCHGECGNINETEEHIYHIKIIYRDEIIAQCGGNKIYVIDDDKYCIWIEGDVHDDGFVIFRKVRKEQSRKTGKPVSHIIEECLS